ncbi:hypothetical protein [Ralstonia sp.]|uniref:hypothetical protein n=1 Tax=Ralstonia sp. TaxID=54061 RepID=UPI0031DA14CF
MTRFYVVFTNHPSGDHLRINAKQYRRNANSKKQGESAHPVLPKLARPVDRPSDLLLSPLPACVGSMEPHGR